MQTNLPQNEMIINYMENLNLHKTYSVPTLKHISEYLTAMALKGYNGKMTDIAEYSDCHRTTIGYFFNTAKWNDKHLAQILHSEVVYKIEKAQRISNKPIIVSVDDTVSCKKKPSSKAKLPIEGASFHHSHLLGKQVWGHQVLASMIKCDDLELNFDIHHYDKKQSKIDYVIGMAKTLPKPLITSYATFDSWFTCPKVIDALETQGYHCIATLKTNRIIYPQGIRIGIADTN